MTKEEEDKKTFWQKFFGIEDVDESEKEEVKEDKPQKETNMVAPPPPVIKEDYNELEKEEEAEKSAEQSYGQNDFSQKETVKVKPVFMDTEPRKKIEVTSDKFFYVYDGGPKIKNLEDLLYYLGTITERQFNHHVRDGANDFANWVNDVLEEDWLAIELQKSETREEMITSVKSFLNINN